MYVLSIIDIIKLIIFLSIVFLIVIYVYVLIYELNGFFNSIESNSTKEIDTYIADKSFISSNSNKIPE